MITKSEVADYINANLTTVLTADEVLTLRKSLAEFSVPHRRNYLCEALIGILGDVTMLVEIRDANNGV